MQAEREYITFSDMLIPGGPTLTQSEQIWLYRMHGFNENNEKKRGLFDLDDGGGDRYQGLAPSSARTRCLRMRGKCAGVLLDRSTSLSSTSTTMINYSLKRWSGFSPPGNTSGKLETKSWPFHSGRVNFFQNQQPMKPGSNSNHYDHDRWPRWPPPGEAWAAVHCGWREDNYRGRRLCKDW